MSPAIGSWRFQAPYAKETRARVMKALIDSGSAGSEGGPCSAP